MPFHIFKNSIGVDSIPVVYFITINDFLLVNQPNRDHGNKNCTNLCENEKMSV